MLAALHRWPGPRLALHPPAALHASHSVNTSAAGQSQRRPATTWLSNRPRRIPSPGAPLQGGDPGSSHTRQGARPAAAPAHRQRRSHARAQPPRSILRSFIPAALAPFILCAALAAPQQGLSSTSGAYRTAAAMAGANIFVTGGVGFIGEIWASGSTRRQPRAWARCHCAATRLAWSVATPAIPAPHPPASRQPHRAGAAGARVQGLHHGQPGQQLSEGLRPHGGAGGRQGAQHEVHQGWQGRVPAAPPSDRPPPLGGIRLQACCLLAA